MPAPKTNKETKQKQKEERLKQLKEQLFKKPKIPKYSDVDTSPFSLGPPVKVRESFWFKITNTSAGPVSIALSILWFRMLEEVWSGLYELFEEYLGVLPR